MPAKLSTHVLDTAHGCPASGMKIELWSLDGEERTLVTTAKTNADGRTETPLLSADEMNTGQYEIVFFVGDYFTAKAVLRYHEKDGRKVTVLPFTDGKTYGLAGECRF